MTLEELCPNTYEEYAKIHGDSFESLKIYRDLRNVIDTAIGEAIEKSNHERNIQLVKNLTKMNLSTKRISEILKISIDEVERLIEQNQL